jgi:hypothetical protein
LPFFVQTLQLIADPLKFLDTCTQRYGDAFTLRLGTCGKIEYQSL